MKGIQSNIQVLIKTGTKEIKMLLLALNIDRGLTENSNKENGRLIGFDESDKYIQNSNDISCM